MDRSVRHVLAQFLAASIYGQCYHLALAMHRDLDWTMIGIMDGVNIIHVGVVSPEGDIWDGRGKVSEEKFAEPFKKDSNKIVIGINEADLIATGTVIEEMVKLYLEKSRIIWPNLPWKTPSCLDRVVAFTEELESLSRKYRLWVCAPFPAARPALFEGYDDEEGYELEITADGRTCLINRKI
ncbi:MAG: hypothetical protein PHG66_04045 [Candidatus Colwellbacteria bacterium]|nr:hypothetical protein [Candidatus Colwellbacteria bacterium]